MFPIQNYIIYSALSVIANFKGNFEISNKYAELAGKNADANTNSLWSPYKNKLGIVTDRIIWLDKIVGHK